MTVSARVVGLLALGALIPAAAFVVLNAEWLAAVALVNVLIIGACLVVAMSPHDHADDPATNST